MTMRKIRVACVGDSITEGTHGKSYPDYMREMLGDGYEVMNFGRGGTTARFEGVMRLPEIDGYNFAYINQEQYKESLKSNPDIVLIMFGTNDSKMQNWFRDYDYKYPLKKCVYTRADEFISDYKNLIKQYIDLPTKPKVFLGTTCIIFDDWTTEDRILIGDHVLGEVMENELIPAERKVAADLDLQIVDIHALTEKLKNEGVEMSSDGMHPNLIYDKLAEEFAKAVKSCDVE